MIFGIRASQKFIALFLSLWFAGVAAAAAPKLTNVLPHGGQRGTEVDITFVGTNLADAQELLLYDSGLEVISFEPPAAPPEQPAAEQARGARGARGGNRAPPSQQLKARLKILGDCPLGSQRLRIRTATGLSDLQNFFVGALPVMEEQEPNTSLDKAQAIPLNVTVHGRIDNEDADCFLLEAKAGQRLSVEVIGTRLGTSSVDPYFDPAITLLNAQRFEVAASDDTTLGRNDPYLSLLIPADGVYTLQIRDASFNGSDKAYYLMHVGDFPRPLLAYPAGGRPGEVAAVKLLGDPQGEMLREVNVPSDPPERFSLEVADELGVAPTGVPFRISMLPNEFEAEPNNNRNQASVVNVPAAWNGIIEPGETTDFFKFSAKKGQVLNIEVCARRISSSLDPVINVVRMDNGQSVVSGDDNRGLDNNTQFTAPEDGDYALSIRDHLQRSGPTFVYRVEVTPAQPQLVATTLEFEQYIQPQIIVPRGGAVGVVATVQKQNVNGAVTFDSDQLPPGVTLLSPAAWQNEGQIPLLFIAEDEAAVAGRFASIWGKVTEPNATEPRVVAALRQEILMVRGANNTRVIEASQQRLPVIVTDNSPFRLWIDAPKVPVVRGGTQDLVIHCERAAGFEGRIELRMLADPPGCSSIKSVRIEPNQTEVRVPFHANVDAPLKEWPISMRGIARIAGGSVEVCTQMVDIRVEEKFLSLEFAKAAAEQGASAQYLIKIKQQRPFEGEAEIKLVGLPAKAVAEPVKITSQSTEAIFEVKVAADTPPGDNKNLQCEVRVPQSGEQILHLMGRGTLRIDPAPVVKADTPPVVKPAGAAPLSRLEQLRQSPPPPASTP